jgi:hypothetical protein
MRRQGKEKVDAVQKILCRFLRRKHNTIATLFFRPAGGMHLIALR